MHIISECVMCAVVVLTLSTFAFAFYVVLLTLKQGLVSRRGTSRAFQNAWTLFLARPAVVVARHKTSDRR